ncbi:cryptochrome/photolyase family protein [Peterkaempfera bronchialis]|uniref:Deoxyribodipyrimidine photo-lyase n=1 Tax=Peterkaempfera bronchialis TaxID=2126346 RepID=A0A345SUH5_9ACTN|nr:deoxyribodipyrimidine photo-lyase [Peterkaempfera bronchialis]AXI77380.1 deoxyribodipyrimidine photo-lyase [Peterkaempfera bronchialis]
MSVSVALFTSDLRVHDQPVLRAALDGAERVVPLFVLDDAVLAADFTAPNRAAFLADCLADLDASLRARGGRLVVRRGDPARVAALLAEQTGAAAVHLAAGVSGYAQRREDRLREALGDRLRVHDAVVTVVAPGSVVPAGRDHFAVFTPYLRRWEQAARRQPAAPPRRVSVPAEVRGETPAQVRAALAAAGAGEPSPALPRGGETEGRRRWHAWQAAQLTGYQDHHDDLAGDATSRLSPYLHFGCLSATELVGAAESVRAAGAAPGPGAEAFVRQLAWRDFHHQVLAARPDAAHDDYRPHGDRWEADAQEVAAWREGRTGYPIVDAGMRQLAHEGWMHNRARLLTASFLAKTLYADWRVGAAHFLRLLVDGDLANNQLNWQWVAGTGTDTRPNRVLNPLTQARRFDPQGAYVRRWIPELAGVEGAAVHQPWRLPAERRAALDYPQPIVDLSAAAQRFRHGRGLY